MKQTPASIETGGDLAVNLASFARHLRAENLSPRTVRTYQQGVEGLARFLAEKGMPQQVAKVTREHVEAYITELLDHWRPATAANRFRSLQQFWKWLVEEGEIRQNPMARMSPPRVPEQPPPVLSDEDLRALLATCEKGATLEDRRDHAILRVLIDTGIRLGEISGLRFDPHDDENNDVGLDDGLLRVLGKGGRERMVPIGNKTLKTLDRYVRVRGRHSAASLPWLWLGHKGRLTDSGVAQVIRRRGREAGLGDLHPHLFRHTYAHRWLAAGGQETDLMRVAGWKSRAMISRYGASAAAERAVAAHKRLALGDSL